MKKLVGLLLALTMLHGLAVPALAAQEEDEYSNTYGYGQELGLEAGFSEGWGEGRADYPGEYKRDRDYPKSGKNYEDKDATFADGYQDSYADGYRTGYLFGYYTTFSRGGWDEAAAQGRADYYAGYELEENRPPMPEGDFPDLDNPQEWTGEFLYQRGISLGYRSGYSEAEAEDYLNGSYDEELLTVYQGVPGQINIRLNQDCIVFPDAVPELRNDRTMVPVRALMEALDAQVEFLDDNLLRITRGGTVISLTVGEKTVTVQEGGQTKQVALDAAGYIKDDRVYVPLRLISEVLGYDVYWDNAFRSVVVLDREAIIAEFDKEHYTVLNRYLMPLLPGSGAREETRELTVSFTDVKGNKTYKGSGVGQTIRQGASFAAKATVDLSKLAPSLPAIRDAMNQTYGIELARLENALIREQGFAARFDPESGYHIQSDLYGWALEEFFCTPAEAGAETWYSLGQMTRLEGEESVGAFVYKKALSRSYVSPFLYYELLTTGGGGILAGFTDRDILQKGSEYILHLGQDELQYLLRDNTSLGQAFRVWTRNTDLTVTFREDGAYSYEGSLELNVKNIASAWKVTFTGSGTPEKSEGELVVEAPGLFKLTIAAKETVKESDKIPDTAIPRPAKIVDLLELFP